jgi:hypothetical protein
MAIDFGVIDALRDRGMVEVTFHATGEIASLRFDTSAVPTAQQPKNEDQQRPQRTQRATGGLVPRGVVEPDR